VNNYIKIVAIEDDGKIWDFALVTFDDSQPSDVDRAANRAAKLAADWRGDGLKVNVSVLHPGVFDHPVIGESL